MTLSTNSITPLSEAPASAKRARDESTTLEVFDSENAEPNRSQSPILTFSERTPVSLAILKQDRIQFDGREAISIGQALCLALMTAQLRRRNNPDVAVANVVPPVTAETVFIDPASRLGVSADDPGDEPMVIQSVGKIMSEIVPSDTRPMLETKIISKALASPPQFSTVGELSQALAAFEQPEGRELIQAVYERWKKGDVTARVGSNTSTSSDSRPTSRMRLGLQPRGVASAVIVVTTLMAGIATWFLMGRSYAADSVVTETEDSTVTVETARLLEARPIAPVTTGLMTWSVARAERPALTVPALSVTYAERRVPTAPSPAVARIERPTPSPPGASIARAKSPVVSDSPMPRPTGDLPSTAPHLGENGEGDATSVSGTSDVIRNSNSVGTAISPSTTEPVKNAPARASSVSDRFARPVTYSAGDADVAPPIPIAPRLLASLQPSSPGIRLDALAIAVVVDENGTAYSVNGINAPQNMGEYVLLMSALAVVKSWEFQPASKDGAPVRYRVIVPLRAVTGSAP